MVSINLLGFFQITQLVVREMLKRRSGSVVTISASLADQPIAGINSSVSMMTKGGLNSITRSLAIEYGKKAVPVDAVAPGAVATSMQQDDPADALNRSPMGKFVEVNDIVSAVLYLAQAGQITGEVLHVDGGAHAGRW